MTILGSVYEKAQAGELLIAATETLKPGDSLDIGEYLGFKMDVYRGRGDSSTRGSTYLYLRGETSHQVTLGESGTGAITRIHNCLNNIPEEIAAKKEALENVFHQIQVAQEAIQMPFEREEELIGKQERLAEVDALLAKDADKTSEPSQDECTAEQSAGNSEKATEHSVFVKTARIFANRDADDLSVCDAEPDNVYSGKISAVGTYFVVQETDAGIILHDKDAFSDANTQGLSDWKDMDSVMIAYDGNVCTIAGCEKEEALVRDDESSIER